MVIDKIISNGLVIIYEGDKETSIWCEWTKVQWSSSTKELKLKSVGNIQVNRCEYEGHDVLEIHSTNCQCVRLQYCENK